jgi:diguanylate cyclase (GGDEF)-like protein
MTTVPDIRDLARQIPRERLTASTRDRLNAALEANDGQELLAASVAAIDELRRAGILVRVALAGQIGAATSLYLVRDTSRLLDLGPLGRRSPPAVTRSRSDDRPATEQVPTDGEPVPAPPRPIPAPSDAQEDRDSGNDRLDDLLEAMERAQDLAVGDPLASEPAVVIQRILELLHGYLPHLRLHVQLFTETVIPETASHVLPPSRPPASPFWQQHRRPGQSLWIPHPHELPAVLQRSLASGPLPPVATAVVPLLAPTDHETEVGLFYVSGPAEWDVGGLLQLAHRLAVFVTRRWQCQRDVNLRVLTDSLTGVHNRAFFDTQFPLELERASRAGLPLTLVIADLDHFKTINDTRGHQCGDRVLQTVAQQLQSRLRRIDHVCRIGGEEFGCLLPCTSLREAREVLQRVINQQFRIALPVELGGGALAVTMSYGAVSFPDAGKTASELHRKADSMLYRAKELGRDRCCLWIAEGHCQQLRPL